MRRIVLLAVVALGAGVLTRADAQGRPGGGRDRGLVEVQPAGVRSGFYFTGALGGAREECRFETQACGVLVTSDSALLDNGRTWRDPITSPAFTLRFGGTPSPNLRLGGELFGWSGKNGPTTERTVGLMASAQFYPLRRQGFYVKGGAGYAWNSIVWPDASSAKYNGFMFNVGAGYDHPLTHSVSLGPVIDFYHSSYPQVGVETISERFLFLGLSVTFQGGGRR